jgi:hypothetical protein
VPDDRALEARNLGADNASVLTGLLGYDPVEVEALETGGVLRSAERD